MLTGTLSAHIAHLRQKLKYIQWKF